MTSATSSPSSTRRSTSFVTPIVLLLVVLAALTGGLLHIAVRGQDRIAREASETIANAALNAERESVSKLVRDYSWWNAAVENLIFDLNPAWIKDNLDWLHENFGVNRVFVLGPHREHRYSSLDAEPLRSDDEAWMVPAFLALIAEAESLPEEPGASSSGYVPFADGVHLVAASKLLEETDTAGHPPYPDKGILVVTQKMDEAFLTEVEHNFQLPNLELAAAPNSNESQTDLALSSADGKAAAYLVWTPARPGQRLLEWLRLPLGVTFVLVAAVIYLIIVRARRASRALQEALDARLAAQKQLEFAAQHDSLTGLPNRALFLEHLTNAIAHTARSGVAIAVHYLDLDGFKTVNDTHGHAVGDALLREAAERLWRIVRASDVVARFGGDEFAVLQREAADRKTAGWIADRIIEAMEVPFELEGRTVRVGVSDGIAFSTPETEPEDVLAAADDVMYRAKREGGGCFRIHEPGSTASKARTRRAGSVTQS